MSGFLSRINAKLTPLVTFVSGLSLLAGALIGFLIFASKQVQKLLQGPTLTFVQVDVVARVDPSPLRFRGEVDCPSALSLMSVSCEWIGRPGLQAPFHTFLVGSGVLREPSSSEAPRRGFCSFAQMSGVVPQSLLETPVFTIRIGAVCTDAAFSNAAGRSL
jgi:hypothetical protein